MIMYLVLSAFASSPIDLLAINKATVFLFCSIYDSGQFTVRSLSEDWFF